MKNLLILSALIFGYNSSYSQNSNCQALLDHGISNIINQYSLETLDQAKYLLFDGVDLDQADDLTIVNLDVKVFGVGDGVGDLTIQQRRTRIKKKRQELFIKRASTSNQISQAKMIYDNAIKAWEKCIELESKANLITEFDILTLGQKVQVKISYVGGAGRPTERSAYKYEGSELAGFKLTEIYPKSFSKDSLIDNRGVTFVYVRDLPIDRIINGYKYKDYAEGNISLVIAGRGNNISIPFPKSLIGPLEVITRPGLGEIVSSVLDVSTLLDVNNDGSQNIYWMLADGSPIPENYALRKNLNIERVPDLRASFLRGKNHGRFPANVVPENRLMQFQSDLTSKPRNFNIAPEPDHKHVAPVIGNGIDPGQHSRNHSAGVVFNNEQSSSGILLREFVGTISQPDARYGLNTGPSGRHNHTISGWDRETVPKNVTVNYFIRVN
nr:hypothetical protein [Cytophagales bacterium]